MSRVRRPGCVVVEGLELVVALAGDEHLGPAVAGHVAARETHAPHLQRLPTVFGSVEVRLLVGRHRPELLAAVGVVVPVVGEAQVALARPVPVAEQHRQGAVAGGQREWRPVGVAVGTYERALAAGGPIRPEVGSERERRQRVAVLPGGAERGGPGVAAGEAKALVVRLELAVAESAQHHVLSVSEYDEVEDVVAVHVDRVRAGHRGEVGGGGRRRLEFECTADRAPVAVQRRRRRSAGDVQIGEAVSVAVEGCDPTADEVVEVAGVRVVDARSGGVVDEPRRGCRGWRCGGVVARR